MFFITQTPKDVDADFLAQLGNRMQHALRAFTPIDAAALKATVRTFPKSDFYDLEQLLQQLGNRGGRGHDPRRVGRPDAGRAHQAASASRQYGSCRRCRVGREGVPALCQVRHSHRRRRERVRCSQPASSKRRHRRAAFSGDGPRQGREGGPGGADVLGDFLKSRTGKQVEREVIRGVFGLLKKSL